MSGQHIASAAAALVLVAILWFAFSTRHHIGEDRKAVPPGHPEWLPTSSDQAAHEIDLLRALWALPPRAHGDHPALPTKDAQERAQGASRPTERELP